MLEICRFSHAWFAWMHKLASCRTQPGVDAKHSRYPESDPENLSCRHTPLSPHLRMNVYFPVNGPGTLESSTSASPTVKPTHNLTQPKAQNHQTQTTSIISRTSSSEQRRSPKFLPLVSWDVSHRIIALQLSWKKASKEAMVGFSLAQPTITCRHGKKPDESHRR